MEIWLAILIPVIVAIFFLYFYSKKIVWWETLLPLVASCIIIFLFKTLSVSMLTKSYEYLGNHITEVRYYEPWDEYINQTCTRTCCCDSKGSNCSTETYDCSYVSHHPAEWVAVLNTGSQVSISKYRYDRLKNKFNNSSFVDMHRAFYSYDGDMYSSEWKGDYDTYEFFASKGTYKNKVKCAHSVFNFPNVPEKEVKKYELYNYPDIQDGNKLNVILGYKGYVHNPITDKKFDWINGMYGQKKQVRVWVLLFKDKPRNIANLQEGYWKGGNKNELNICIGVDKSNNVKWCHIISWTESQAMKVRTKNYVESMEKLNLDSLAGYLTTNIPKDWKRKRFRDFEYLTVETPTWALITTYILVFLASIGINIWSISNKYDNDNNNFKNRY